MNKKLLSLNDQRFLNIMEKTVKLNNGHHKIALPWKFHLPCLQNTSKASTPPVEEVTARRTTHPSKIQRVYGQSAI